MLGFIKRNTKCFTHNLTKIILYNTLVRSHLEFASVAWNPFYTIHSQRIESIQRNFTRYLAFTSQGIFHRSPYKERLDHFKMTTLRNRRMLHDLVFLFKIVNGSTGYNKLISRISLTVPYNYPRKPIAQLFNTPFSRTNLGLSSPLTRICNEYSFITENLAELDPFGDSLQIFKTKLMKKFLGILLT